MSNEETPHLVNGRECRCAPEILQPCPECDVPGGDPDPDCWSCGGRGLVPEFDEGEPAVIVHRTIEKVILDAGL